MGKMTTILFLLLGVWPAAAVRDDATTRVQVVTTDPAGHVVTLGRHQTFYLRLHYDTDQPVRIWARPFFHGEEVRVGSNPSRVYPAGSGEALGWFFLSDPRTQVDEVRITAGDGSLDGTPVVATYNVQITGGDRPLSTHRRPAWVTRLRALDAAAQKADYEKRMNAPVSAGDTILFSGFMLAVFALGILGMVAPAWGVWRWRGGWRVAAAVPAALMAFVVLRIFVDVSADPASHNLWPFEILPTSALSAVIMAGLLVARKFAGVGRAR